MDGGLVLFPESTGGGEFNFFGAVIGSPAVDVGDAPGPEEVRFVVRSDGMDGVLLEGPTDDAEDGPIEDFSGLGSDLIQLELGSRVIHGHVVDDDLCQNQWGSRRSN